MTKKLFGQAWCLLYILHDGSQETYLDFQGPDQPCTAIYVTNSGYEFTADYKSGALHPYSPNDATTEMWDIPRYEPDWQLWEHDPPPFIKLKHMHVAPISVWWRRA